MKKLILISIMVLTILSACLADDSLKTANKLNEKEIKKIALISDTHLQLGDLSDGVSYINSINNELIEAVLYDIEKKDCDMVILLGDNTNSGRLAQHETLIDMLKNIKPEVLVVVGNHDIGEVTKEEIPELYYEYGYKKALSKDKKTLSYSLVYNDLMLILLDTNNEDKWEVGYPVFEDKTLNWLKEQLNYGKNNNKKIICLGHYPLVTRQDKNYEIIKPVLDILDKYELPLYIAGHLHYHAVSTFNNLKEVVISQTTSYPLSYEILEIKDDELILTPTKVDVEGFAEEKNIDNDKLLNFDTYLNNQYRKKCEDIIKALIENKEIDEEELPKAIDLFYKVMKYRSDGTLYLHKEEIINHEGYAYFEKISEGTIWNTWIPLVLKEANEDTMGFKVNLP